MTAKINRCRLVLIVPDGGNAEELRESLSQALRGGDVSTVIVPQYAHNDIDFQKIAEALVPVIQEAGAAALVAGDTRIAGRVHADGLHITGNAEAVAEAVEHFAPKLIVGGGNAAERHRALEIGESAPDYIFFGKLDGDIKPEAHQKNLALAEWWSSMIEIPCIVMAGSAPESVVDVANNGAEFVAVSKAVFSHAAGPAQAVSEINALLDEKAPRFER